MILKGGANQGKTETLRIVSNMVAINYIECETKIHLKEDTVLNLLSGVISGGYWILIKNLESCSIEVISILANYADSIHQKMMLDNTRMTLGSNDLLIKDNLAIFATFRVTGSADQRKFNKLPLNLLENFRVITFQKPNYSVIIEHLISFVMTSKEARTWSNKILMYSKMYKNIENFDFLIKGQERAESLERDGQSVVDGIDIDLKLICFFIYAANLLFFFKLNEFYEEFSTGANYVYMNSTKATIDITFNKRNLFTLLFKKTLLIFFRKRGAAGSKISLFNTLFNKIFEEEISTSN